MKKIIKGVAQMIIAAVVFFVAIYGGFEMYVSRTFIPVYDGAGHWHLFPQLLRYGLYAILGANALLAAYAAYEAGKFLTHRFKRWVRYSI